MIEVMADISNRAFFNNQDVLDHRQTTSVTLLMDSFMLPVAYEEKEMEFETRLVRAGYIYKFVVLLNEKELEFERDEEGHLRVISHTEDVAPLTTKEKELVPYIMQSLQAILG